MKILHKPGGGLQSLAVLAAFAAIVPATNAAAQIQKKESCAQIIGFEFEEVMLFESAGAGAKSKSVPAPDIGTNNPIPVLRCESNMYQIKIDSSTGWVLDLDVTTAIVNTSKKISAETVPFAGPTLGAPRGYGKGSER